MIRKIEIENFKSVKKLKLELGRVTVLIGENGAGKSNILEAIAFAGAAAANKLDNEFLSARGIRVSDDPRMMMTAFPQESPVAAVTVTVWWAEEDWIKCHLTPPNKDNSPWKSSVAAIYPGDTITGRKFAFDNSDRQLIESAVGDLKTVVDGHSNPVVRAQLESSIARLVSFFGGFDEAEAGEEFAERAATFRRYLVYAPENRELRTFAEEGQILPLGIRGEGLFRLLKILSQQDDGARLAILKEKLQLIDWFEDFEFQQDAMPYERRLLIRDRHLSESVAHIDQRSANEGFLFLLFYFCLFLSDATPSFFAIDNIDSSLNPKLCAQLVRELVQMAKTYGKQVILTTHNPAVLDGLNLKDDEQRLYVVRRNIDGETVARPVLAPTVPEGQRAVPLSEAFLRGYIGGLPNNF